MRYSRAVGYRWLANKPAFIPMVRPWMAERQRRVELHALLLIASGMVERDGEAVHLIAGRLEYHSRLLAKLETESRDVQRRGRAVIGYE